MSRLYSALSSLPLGAKGVYISSLPSSSCLLMLNGSVEALLWNEEVVRSVVFFSDDAFPLVLFLIFCLLM